MRRAIALLILAFLLVPVIKLYAETREAQHIYEGETYFEKVGATGNQNTGNPGYFSLVGPDSAGVNFTYYLWVNQGKLYIASYPTVSTYTSFPSGDWRLPPFNAGTVVGSQS